MVGMRNDVPTMKLAGRVSANHGSRHVLPRPIEVSELSRIAARFRSVMDSKIQGPVHLISVANSGYPIGTAAAMELLRSNAHRQVYLSCVDPFAPLNTFDDFPNYSCFSTILVDNSIKTGETAVQSVKILHDAGIGIDFLVKLVEYDDVLENEAFSYILGVSPSVEIVSLYSEEEIKKRIAGS